MKFGIVTVDSWDLLYKLLRSKEQRMMMMMMMMKKKMIAARLYIYFPYGEISNKIIAKKIKSLQ